MQDKNEKPFRRHELFILGLMAGFSTSISIILYFDDMIMPKIMTTIISVAFITASLYFLYYEDKEFK
jgi:hypothetical protein